MKRSSTLWLCNSLTGRVLPSPCAPRGKVPAAEPTTNSGPAQCRAGMICVRQSVGAGLVPARIPRGTRNSWARACLFVLGFAALTPTYRPTGLSGWAHERAPIRRGGHKACSDKSPPQIPGSTVGWGERSEPQRRPPHPQNGIPGGHKFPETVGRTEGACGRIPGRHKACPYKLRAGTRPAPTNCGRAQRPFRQMAPTNSGQAEGLPLQIARGKRPAPTNCGQPQGLPLPWDAIMGTAPG